LNTSQHHQVSDAERQNQQGSEVNEIHRITFLREPLIPNQLQEPAANIAHFAFRRSIGVREAGARAPWRRSAAVGVLARAPLSWGFAPTASST
jgi:hypothetical protein